MGTPDLGPEPRKRAGVGPHDSRAGVSHEIPLGPFVLHVGDDAGTEARLAPAQTRASSDGAQGTSDTGAQGTSDTGAQENARTLAGDLRKFDKEKERQSSAPEALEDATDKASQVTTKVEHVNTLCTQVISGEVSIDSISAETDALIGLLGRLDRAGRWEEELRLARCASKLLSLAKRWLELLRILRAALQAAERLGDANATAWTLHELGTLRLAVHDDAQADELLGRARELRERCGDRRGLAMTERNLQVLCRSLRSRLHRQRRSSRLGEALRRPVPAVAAAAVLLAAGGSAGAVIAHRSSGAHRTTQPTSYGPGRHMATVTISFSPLEPHAGEAVSFRAIAANRNDRIAGYRWDFGDGDPSQRIRVTHTYHRAGTFKLVLLARDARGRTIGEASASIGVLPGSRHEPSGGGGHRHGASSGGNGGDETPTAKFTFSPSSPTVGHQVSFDARGSTPGAGSLVGYSWRFGDGGSYTGRAASHAFARPQTYDVTLTVTNSHHRAATVTRKVSVTAEKAPTATLTLNCPRTLPFGAVASASGTLSPAKAEAIVHVLFVPPSGGPRSAEATVNPDGSFAAKTKADEQGAWEARGEWRDEGPGDSAKGTCKFDVEPQEPALDTRTYGVTSG